MQRPEIPTFDPFTAAAVDRHWTELMACRRCATVVPPPVSGRPEGRPSLMLVGQAPGPREVELRRPFAYTAGSRLFAWFARLGVSEEEFRARVWISAVIRCFPGRAPQGGDRVPSPGEIAHCAPHLETELRLLQPQTVIAVGQLAIARFLPAPGALAERVGETFPVVQGGHSFAVIPLPHPSGRSTWLVRPENQARLDRALHRLAESEGWQRTFGTSSAAVAG
jgi:uracil-DNA glycosylase